MGHDLVHRITRRSFAIAILIGSSSASAATGTINVPADYATIQGAIDAAVDGDVVLVAPGTYFENIDFKGKAITVQSSDGPEVTTIDGGGVDTVVRFVSGESSGSMIDGFHLTNGFGPGTQFPYDGGGISCHHGSSPRIRNNFIDYNGTNSGSGGGGAGGIYCDSSSPTIEGNRIWNNQGVGAGGIMTYGGASPFIIDCDIQWNTSTWGGGLQCSHSSATLVNTVIAFNTATFEGGGVQQGAGGAVTLVNCVVWGNTCAGNGGIFVWLTTITLWNCVVWNNSAVQIYLKGGTADTHSCNVQGGWGSGDIDADPLFIDPVNGDFHLGLGSPCIDAASASAPFFPTEDFDGDPRIVDSAPDIGADEQSPTPIVLSVAPDHGRYDQSPKVTIHGSRFTIGGPIGVRFGLRSASNIVILDDANLTCDVPTSAAGPAEIGVSNAYGEGVLPSGFLFTPAITIDGDPTPGGSITIHYLFDKGDGVLAILGLPPIVTLPVPPFDGELCIVPFTYFFYVPTWPFNGFDVIADIPNDPSFIGLDVLVQALVGPALTKKPKDGAWTNCAVLSIR